MEQTIAPDLADALPLADPQTDRHRLAGLVGQPAEVGIAAERHASLRKSVLDHDVSAALP